MNVGALLNCLGEEWFLSSLSTYQHESNLEFNLGWTFANPLTQDKNSSRWSLISFMIITSFLNPISPTSPIFGNASQPINVLGY